MADRTGDKKRFGAVTCTLLMSREFPYVPANPFYHVPTYVW